MAGHKGFKGDRGLHGSIGERGERGEKGEQGIGLPGPSGLQVCVKFLFCLSALEYSMSKFRLFWFKSIFLSVYHSI